MKERFREAMRRFLGRWFFPEIAELEGRLKVCHQRMQEMYWDEKAKELAMGRIASLVEILSRACITLHLYNHTRDAEMFSAEAMIPWDENEAEKWRLAPADPPVALPSGNILFPEGCVFAGTDPAGWCRTHNRQCLSPEEFMRRMPSEKGAQA